MAATPTLTDKLARFIEERDVDLRRDAMQYTIRTTSSLCRAVLKTGRDLIPQPNVITVKPLLGQQPELRALSVISAGCNVKGMREIVSHQYGSHEQTDLVDKSQP